MPTKRSRDLEIRKRSAASERLLARLRPICMALPEAVEKLSHGEPTWFAGKGKVFAMFDDHHHGAEHVSVWVPQPLGIQEQLIAADPVRFFRPPYVGPSGWVAVVLSTRPDWGEVEHLIREGYRHVAGHRLRARLDLPAPPPSARRGTARKPRTPRR